jgi:hypothetical protein
MGGGAQGVGWRGAMSQPRRPASQPAESCCSPAIWITAREIS